MKYKAVLIANWTYDEAKGLPSLDGPKQDLDVLARALTDEKSGLYEAGNILTIPDKGTVEVREKLAEFLSTASRDEALLIYFSGHGVPAKDDLVLCTKDTNREHPLAMGIEVSYINKNLPTSRSEQTIVILDCCFAGRAVKGLGTLDLNFAQNLYCLASSGAYEVTLDAKTKGTASPFTAELARLLVKDDEVAVDESGAITLDAVWDQLLKFTPRPVRSVLGGGSLRIARRGDLRDAKDRFLNPLHWLLPSPAVQTVTFKVNSKSVSASWPEQADDPDDPGLRPVNAELRGLVPRTLELIDGVGRLEEKATEQWSNVARSAWQELGEMLLKSVMPEALRNYVRKKVGEREIHEILTLSFQLDLAHESCPWEALHDDAKDSEAIRDFLALAEGILVERICDVTRPLPNEAQGDVPYGICAANLSPEETQLSEQIIRELKQRAPELHQKAPPWTLEGVKCNWNRFLDTAQPRLLILTLPLRRVSGGQVEVGFNSGNQVDWKRTDDILDRLKRWNRPHGAVIIETVASSPSYDAYCASVEFARRLTQQGFGPAVFLCHPRVFSRYPVDERQIPVTFAGQLVAALLLGSELPPAVHHARSAPLQMNPGIKQVFGFPGYYSPRLRSQGGIGPGEKSSSLGPKIGSHVGDKNN